MENCKQIFSLLSDYVNGELPPDTESEIKQHVEGCAPCVEFLDSLKHTINLCQNFQLESIPEPLRKAALEQLRSEYEKALARR